MKASLVAIEPNGHFCRECSIREFSMCASLDPARAEALVAA
jgi:CRP/FNR family transcriptional regulator, anaerobic regulatory protein